MAESIEEIKKLENEKSSREAHGNTERRPHGSSKELERVKEDLRMTQDYLRIATDTNSLLQVSGADVENYENCLIWVPVSIYETASKEQLI